MLKPLTLILSITFLVNLITFTKAQSVVPDSSNLILNIMKNNDDDFTQILNSPNKYKIQIIYTQINRDEKNFPHFKTYSYHFDPNKYFYPASTVKLPATVIALEKLNNLNI